MGTGDRRGMTLLELMVVLGIMSVLFSAAVFKYAQHLKHTRLRSTIEMIGGHLREVRWAARMQGETWVIQFDTVRRTYSINGKDTIKLPEGIRFGTDPDVTGKPGMPYEAPPEDGVSFDFGGSKNKARYYATGTVAPTGSVFITDEEETLAVTVAITGRPKLWRSCGGKRWMPI